MISMSDNADLLPTRRLVVPPLGGKASNPPETATANPTGPPSAAALP
jgi:hypothetical protein